MHVNSARGIYNSQPHVIKKDQTRDQNQRHQAALEGRRIKAMKSGSPDAAISTVLFLSFLVLGAPFMQAVMAAEQGALQNNIQGSFQARETENAHFRALVHLCNTTEHRLNTTQALYDRCVTNAENLTNQLGVCRERGEDAASLEKSLERQNRKVLTLEKRLRAAQWQKTQAEKSLIELRSNCKCKKKKTKKK